MKKKQCKPTRFYKWKKLFLMMRITAILMLTTLIHVSASVYSQKTNLELKLKDVSVEEVLQKIEEQSNFYFLYRSDFLRNLPKVSIDVTGAGVEEILNQIIVPNGFGYEIDDKIVVIRKTSEAPVLNHQAQKTTVKGKVTDSSGVSLPGVSVVVKGTSQGIITDTDGSYSLPNVPTDGILMFSFVGMKTQEVSISGKSQINVIMEEETIGIDEVVAVGYGTQKKVNLTGAVATVNNEELVKVPVASTTQALTGRLPGLVSKETTGKPGSTPSISVRGFGTPLVIVDGVEQENYYNIDPNEIESFSLLKDASAAIYGARAGNGVILITTKRGKSGEPKITFSNTTSIQTPTIYPEFVDSWEYAIIQNEANAFAGKSVAYTDEEIQKFKDGTDPDYPNIDHYHEVIKKWSLMQTNNLNVSGGSEKVNYFFSVGYLFQDGIYRANGVDMNRYNIRSNIDLKVAKNLSAGLDLSTRITDHDDVPTTSYDIFQTIGTTTNRFPAHYPDKDKSPYVGRNAHSPYIKTNRNLMGYDDTNRQYLTGTLTLKYDIPFIKGLDIKIKGHYVGDQIYEKKWTKPYSTYYYDRDNDVYTIAATSGKYSLTEKEDRARELTFQGMVEYENRFGNHDVKALLVHEIIDSKSNWFNAYIDGFASGAIEQMSAGSSNNMSVDGSASEESRMSYVGRFNYGYKSKYLLESTIRYDGSSRFASGHRWALFPSISLGWRISDEKFIKENVPFIDNLKLRLSFSHTGYDRNADAYQYLSTYSYNTQYVLGGAAYQTISSDGFDNPSISWEDIYTYNSGLDVDFWNGLLGAEVDVFYRLRDGILGERTSTLPNTFGAEMPEENINSMDNRGFELVLKHRNKIRDFRYSLSANISWTREKYVDYAEQDYDDADEERLYKKTGQWTNRTFGYKTNGFFQSQNEIDNSDIDYDQAGNTTLQPGMVKYVDVNNDKKINWRDQVEIGRGTTPEIMFGLNVACNYKGFDLNMLWQGAAHYDIQFESHMQTLTINSVWNSYKFLYNGRWTEDNPDAEFPGTTSGYNSYNAKTSDLWRRSANYIRLKNLTLGYTMPKKWINKTGISDIRIYVAGYNLLTFDKIKTFQYDPETGASLTYPLYKSLSFGFNVTL